MFIKRTSSAVSFQNLAEKKAISHSKQNPYLVGVRYVKTNKQTKKSDHLAYNQFNHNHNKIVKSDWLSTALISALIGQFNRTVRVMPK